MSVLEESRQWWAWADIYPMLIACISPLAPVPTILLAFYYARLRWWISGSTLRWGTDSVPGGCCRLDNHLQFGSGALLVFSFFFAVHRQHSAQKSYQLRLLQEQAARVRIEQLDVSAPSPPPLPDTQTASPFPTHPVALTRA